MEHRSRERSESPSVPPVAESVEIITDPSEQEMIRQTEATASFNKRASAANWERQAAKNPRLIEGRVVYLPMPLCLSSSLSLTHSLSVYNYVHVYTCVMCMGMYIPDSNGKYLDWALILSTLLVCFVIRTALLLAFKIPNTSTSLCLCPRTLELGTWQYCVCIYNIHTYI